MSPAAIREISAMTVTFGVMSARPVSHDAPSLIAVPLHVVGAGTLWTAAGRKLEELRAELHAVAKAVTASRMVESIEDSAVELGPRYWIGVRGAEGAETEGGVEATK